MDKLALAFSHHRTIHLLTLALAFGYPLAASATPALSNLPRFGAAVVFGEFNGDGIKEMVVGDPNLSVGGRSRAGSIRIYYTTASFHLITHNTPGFPHAPEGD